MARDSDAGAYGVDGCRGGWFCFFVCGERFGHGLHAGLDDLLSTAQSAAPIMIDMPIGLTSGDPPVRTCDVLARRMLGPRAASVFSAPSRPALGCDEYAQASDVNERCTGRRLSRQTWGLVPRIRELDALLAARPEARGRMRECHPELCFLGLGGGVPMGHYKKTQAGYEERLRILETLWAPARHAVTEALDGYPRARVARDDVVDALVLALAGACANAGLEEIPARQETDALGLPMRIVYPRPGPP